jgi:hypothetical protein
MQRLIFEYSPAFIILCLALGLGYAWVLYQKRTSWGFTTNRILFGVRALAVALLAFLLIGPILKLTTNQFEKPALVFLVDNSLSVGEVVDSTKYNALIEEMNAHAQALREKDYEVEIRGIGEGNDVTPGEKRSDLHGSMRNVIADYEGKNLAGIVLLSDGIYNSGPSPLYTPLRIPVYTVGIGDTTQRLDISIRNVAFNKIAYQGNRFPLRAEVLVKGLPDQEVTVAITQGGKQIGTQSRNSGNKTLLDFDFQIDANETGMQRIDVVVNQVANESNTRNNRTAVFVEVVEGKKQILVVSPSPHPDIKVLRSAIEKNSNYEFHLHIPGVIDADPALLQPGKADLVIVSQVFDPEGKTFPVLQKFLGSNTGLLLMTSLRSNLRQFNTSGIPIVFEGFGQKDESVPAFNNAFRDFSFSEGLPGVFARYPPIAVPFGKFTYPPDAAILLYQRIGSVTTNRPMLFSWNLSAGSGSNKIAVLLGEGIWKWRLNEYADNENSDSFDEVFSKLVQYLSTAEDRRKFRSFPVQNEFSDAEPVVFESQLYNDLFQQVYGNTVDIELTPEDGNVQRYSYVTSPSGSRYRIGGLREGIYKYRSSTEVEGKREQVSGEFLVTAQNIELQNLTADFGLLKKLADNSGGKFYRQDQTSALVDDVAKPQVKSLIHTEESFHPMINLKAVFFLLVFLLSLEWFTRKYLGGY